MLYSLIDACFANDFDDSKYDHTFGAFVAAKSADVDVVLHFAVALPVAVAGGAVDADLD